MSRRTDEFHQRFLPNPQLADMILANARVLVPLLMPSTHGGDNDNKKYHCVTLCWPGERSSSAAVVCEGEIVIQGRLGHHMPQALEDLLQAIEEKLVQVLKPSAAMEYWYSPEEDVRSSENREGTERDTVTRFAIER